MKYISIRDKQEWGTRYSFFSINDMKNLIFDIEPGILTVDVEDVHHEGQADFSPLQFEMWLEKGSDSIFGINMVSEQG